MKMLLVRNDFDDTQIICDVFRSLFKTVKISEESNYIVFYFSYDDDSDIISTLNALETELVKNIHAYLSINRPEGKLGKELEIAISLMDNLPIGIYGLKNALLKSSKVENKNKVLNFILDNSSISIDFIRDFCQNDLNVSRASKNMFIHRNTMIYKLNKLKINSGFDLTNFKDAYILYSLLEK